jgi:septum formation protein
VKLLLASKSAARRAMLEAAGVPFGCVEAALDEEQAKAQLRARGANAADLAIGLAEEKARSVAAPEGVLVLGSDQVLERHDGSMLDKPSSIEEAREQLLSLAGRTHRLHSAGVVIEDGRAVWWKTEQVELKMRPLGDAFLDGYLAAEYEAIRWSVGGYRIEGPGVQLFDRVNGSHFAILGLPLLPLLAYLRERGLILS